MSRPLRLFLALDLPDEVRESIARAQRSLKATGADVRWVRPGSIHLTLKFLGPVEERLVDGLVRTVEKVAAGSPPLELYPAGAGVFPRPKSPRVVWLGLAGDLEPLIELAKGLNAALEPLGFEPEKRKFNPHLTLGRVKSGRNRLGLIDQVLELRGFKGPPFTARELILFKSDLHPSGAVYTALKEFSLNG